MTSSVSDLAQKIQGLFGVTLSAIIQSCTTLLVGVIIGLIYSWRIGLVGLACVPLACTLAFSGSSLNLLTGITVSSGLVRLKVVTLKVCLRVLMPLACLADWCDRMRKYA